MTTALTTLASGNACIQRQALTRFRLDAPNAERLSCMSQERLSTRWEGEALLVRRDEQLLDRIAAAEIRRVILVCDGGDTPSDLSCAIIDLGAEHVILPADSGIVSCVHFERHGFWMQHPCVYWVESAHARLPPHLRPGLRLLRRPRPGYTRLPSSEVAPLIDCWPLEGPQTWEQRKWARIVAKRGLPPAAH